MTAPDLGRPPRWCRCGHTLLAHDGGLASPCMPLYCECKAFVERVDPAQLRLPIPWPSPDEVAVGAAAMRPPPIRERDHAGHGCTHDPDARALRDMRAYAGMPHPWDNEDGTPE